MFGCIFVCVGKLNKMWREQIIMVGRLLDIFLFITTKTNEIVLIWEKIEKSGSLFLTFTLATLHRNRACSCITSANEVDHYLGYCMTSGPMKFMVSRLCWCDGNGGRGGLLFHSVWYWPTWLYRIVEFGKENDLIIWLGYHSFKIWCYVA